MSTEAENLEFFNSFEGVNAKPTITLSVYDYMEMKDNVLKEERLIKAFDAKLDKIEGENGLKEYEASLKSMKSAKQIKTTAYKMIALGSKVTTDKWNDDLKPYMDKINYPYETVETTEQKYDKKSESLKSVQMIHISNNLKYAFESDLGKIQEISEFILENFELSEEQVTGFNEILSLINTTSPKTESITEGQFIKVNESLYKFSSKLVLNRLERQLTEIDTQVKKLEMSVNFLNWKLKRIQIRKNVIKSAKLDKEFISYESELQFKLKEGKTFTSLLNARPKKA